MIAITSTTTVVAYPMSFLVFTKLFIMVKKNFLTLINTNKHCSAGSCRLLSMLLVMVGSHPRVGGKPLL